MNVRAILMYALLCSPSIRGQVLMVGLEPGGTGKLFPSDAAVLEIREPIASLPCAVKPVAPELGFDFAFHTGYEVRLRLRDLAGNGNVLTTIFRVTPESAPDRPVYFEQKWRVPPIEESAEGSTSLEGSFSLGEGDYQVDWLMRDRHERVCSAYWRISGRMPAKAGSVPAGLAPGAVVPTASGVFSVDERIKGSAEQPLKVAILLNVGPQNAGGATISPREREVLVSILRGIERDPRIGKISITAFNLELNQVVFQQENIRHINFAGLSEAMTSLSLGTVSVSQLAERNSEARFLIELAGEHAKQTSADALIFIGSKPAETAGIPRDQLQQLGEANCPVFYLTYNVNPGSNPWPDLIGNAVKYWRGREFNISRPLDLLSAWSKIMSQLGKGNPWRRPSGN